MSFSGKFAIKVSIWEDLPRDSNDICNAASQIITQGNSATPPIPPTERLQCSVPRRENIFANYKRVDSSFILSIGFLLNAAISTHRLLISNREFGCFDCEVIMYEPEK